MKHHTLIKPFIVIVATLSLSACGLLFKTGISDYEAEKDLEQQIQLLSNQFVVTQHNLKIELSGDNSVVNGTISGHMIAETFLIDKVVTLPDGTTISLIRHVKDSTDSIDIPVSATFFQDNNKVWQFLGTPTFGVLFQSLGQPLSAYPTGLDINSDKGKKLLELSRKYDADVKEQESVSRTLTEVFQFKARIISDSSNNSNFQTITYGGIWGDGNWKNWILFRQYYPEYWASHNLEHVFDEFPPGNGVHILSYGQYHKVIDPILTDTVIKDTADYKQRLTVLSNEITSLQEQFKTY